MKRTAQIVALCFTRFLATVTLGQSVPDDSLCSLQQEVAEGTHLAVRVAGVYNGGLGMGILYDAACKENTWVELALESKKNRKKLGAILDRSRRSEALVVFEGELYGPPPADPNLPEPLRKSYHPGGWGHLGCCRTKLVVRSVLQVSPTETVEKKTSTGAESRRDDRQ
jgi:hypothetical protein